MKYRSKIVTAALLLATILLGVFLFRSCSTNISGKVKNIPNVSHIRIEPIQIRRFDKDLLQLDTNNIENGLQKISAAYPDFLPIYIDMLRAGSQQAEPPQKVLDELLRSDFMRSVMDTCSNVIFDNNHTRTLEKQLDDLFRRYKYYCPTKTVPKVVSCVSAFNYGVFIVSDSLVGIGLDFYLGADYPPYAGMFPRYVSRAMNRDHLTANLAEALADDLLGAPEGDRLVDFMIHNGKKLYIMQQLLPHQPDSTVLGFSQAQTDWCVANEMQMWSFFLEENLLYSTNAREFQKYITPSPNSPRMPEGAPGKTANWLGLKIVERFMERKPNTSLQELVAIRNPQRILDEARYKPKLY